MGLCVCDVCVYESLSVCVSMSAAGEGLHCRYSERSSAQASQPPHRRPSGDSPAELLVRGEAACTAAGNLTEKSELE